MAQVDVLVAGYARSGDAGNVVGSTVAMVRSGDLIAVVDPGMVADQQLILDPIKELGVVPEDVTDVVFSHHHPDHTVNAALFPEARIHDHWAIYHHDRWTDRPAEGFALAEDVVLWANAGSHATGHQHGGGDRRWRGRAHPPVVARDHARRSTRHRPGPAAPQPRPRAGGRQHDRPRPRPRVRGHRRHARIGHPPDGPAVGRQTRLTAR